MNRNAVLAAVLFGSASFVGALNAAPLKQMAAGAPIRIAAAEKKEVEGTKADIKEDKAEAKAMAHHKMRHVRPHKAATHT